jgi:hypothetical protein
MRRTRWIAVPAVAFALVGGCGLRSDAGGGVDVVASAGFLADAAQRTTDAGTGRFEMTMEMTGFPGATGPARMAGEGAYDSEAGRASIRMDMSGLVDVVAGAAGADDPDAAEAAQVFAEPVDLVIDGSTFYMRLPALAEATGREWISFDAGSAAGGIGSPVSPGSLDPRAVLDFLHGADEDVQTVGTEDVRDVATTRLHATVTKEDVLANVPADQRASVEAAFAAFESTGAELAPFPVDVWVDGDGFVRRVQVAYQLPFGGGAGTGGGEPGTDIALTVSSDYFGFGEAVEITVPSPDEVTDAFGGLDQDD